MSDTDATSPDARTPGSPLEVSAEPSVPSRSARRPGLLRRHLGKILGVVLGLGLIAMLLATIYLTLFDLQWIGFLLGIVFAGVLALASQSAKAHWLVLRRTAQFNRAREVITEQNARMKRVSETAKLAEARLNMIMNALSLPIVFVDRNERCHYYNLAFERWSGQHQEGITGIALRAVLGPVVYEDLQPHATEALVGNEASHTGSWLRPNGKPERIKAVLLPFPSGTTRPTGFYLILERQTGAASADTMRVVETSPPASPAPRADPRPPLDAAKERDLREVLVQALAQDKFTLFGQPIVPISPSAAHARVQEVLLRLRDTDDEMLLPSGFLPVAERHNLLGDIDRWVVRNLLEWCAAKRREDHTWDTPLYCVNLSTSALIDPAFARHVYQHIDSSGISGHHLCFEIAAAALQEYTAGIEALMKSLKVLGCRFTVDGLEGTHASFAPLRKLRFDFLKIDGFTVLNMLQDDADLAKVKAMVLTARKLNVPTIAQFVESKELRDRLATMGVDYVQGFGVAKPAPLTETNA